MGRNTEPYELTGSEVIHQTRDAVLVSYDGEEIWIPKSVCIDGDEVEIGDTDISVRSWWAEQEGLD